MTDFLENVKTKIVHISDKKFVDDVANFYYEVNGRRELISYMLNNDMRTDTPAYRRYHQDYMNYYIQYVKMKDELENKYVYAEIDNPISWNLDFETYEIVIYYVDEE